MEIIAGIPVVGGTLAFLLPFVVVISLVVFVHEYGHYIVGRWRGIHAEVFSLGFGPVMFSRVDRRGTRWQLAAIPLGGYVKFLGDRNAASEADATALASLSPEERARSFQAASLSSRALTVLAGPVANLILSILIFATIAIWQGVATRDPVIGEVGVLPNSDFDLLPGDRVLEVNGQSVESIGEIFAILVEADNADDSRFLIERDGVERLVKPPYHFPPRAIRIEPLSPASRAGLEPGDVVLAIDGEAIVDFSELQSRVISSQGVELELTVWRAGEIFTTALSPEIRPIPDGEGRFTEVFLLGISGGPSFFGQVETPNALRAMWLGVRQVGYMIEMSFQAMADIISGEISASNLQGPIGIAQMSSATASESAVSLVSLIGLISTAIAVLNLLPVPVLDGGHLLMFAIEGIKGRPPSEKSLRIAMSIGLAMVLMLMLFATYNDLMRLLPG